MSWKSLINDKETALLARAHEGNWHRPDIQENLLWWETFQDLLETILPIPAEETDGHYSLIAWWDLAKKKGLITYQERERLVRIGVNDLYF